MRKCIELPEIPAHDRTPLVEGLVKRIEELAERVQRQEETIGQLRDEVAVLKGEKKRPTFKPSKLDERAGQEEDPQKAQSDKRPGSEKRSKTQALKIHEEKIIPPERIPEGSRFKGYDDYTVQELVLHAHNIRYRLERWLTSAGDFLRGQLPESVQDGHFGPRLVSVSSKYWIAESGRFPVVIREHATEPLATMNNATRESDNIRRLDQLVAQALVIPLGVIMRQVFSDSTA